MKLKPKIVKYGGVFNPTKKSTITQLQKDWLAMEMQVMRELCKSTKTSEN